MPIDDDGAPPRRPPNTPATRPIADVLKPGCSALGEAAAPIDAPSPGQARLETAENAAVLTSPNVALAALAALPTLPTAHSNALPTAASWALQLKGGSSCGCVAARGGANW